jgi:hypothetical protein
MVKLPSRKRKWFQQQHEQNRKDDKAENSSVKQRTSAGHLVPPASKICEGHPGCVGSPRLPLGEKVGRNALSVRCYRHPVRPCQVVP